MSALSASTETIKRRSSAFDLSHATIAPLLARLRRPRVDPKYLSMKDDELTVYYDGACPLCRREVDYYRTRSQDVVFTDVNEAPDSVLGDDLDRDAALKRFHVRGPDGAVMSGADAFAKLWLRTPSLRWIGAVVSRQPIRFFAALGYRFFLRIRPLMQSAARKTIGD